MKTAVCDDDELFLERIKNMLQTYPEVSACDTYNDINALFDKIDVGMSYDLVFMDVEWKTQKEDGIQYAARLSAQYPDMQIIFVTAYNDRFSQKIFWQPVNLCGYLVKPVSEENLSVLLKKAESNCLANRSNTLIVQYKGPAERISCNSILYLESRAHQIWIYTLTGTIMVYEKLDEYEKCLKDGFLRAHKSYLVNMQYIRRIDRKGVILQNGVILPVSKSRFQGARESYFHFMRTELQTI